MNILFSIEHLEFGGAQTMVLSLTSALAEKEGLSIFIYNHSPEKLNRSMVKSLLSPKVKNISIDQNPVINFISWKVNAVFKMVGLSFSFRAKFKEWYFKYCLNKYKIDVVSSHLMSSDYLCALILNKSKIPLIVTEHCEYSIASTTDIAKAEHIKNIFSNTDAIVSVSEYCRKAISVFTKDFTGVICTIYNGVTLKKNNLDSESRKKLGISNNSIVFGLVGRGVKEKGWDEAIEAFNKVIDLMNSIEIHLIFVGAGEYLENLKKNNFQLNNRIHFVGFSSDPGYWIQAFDVGLLPSYAEALGNAIVEYMFYGKPVIATKVGGIPEAIADGEEIAGFLVDILDGKPAVNQLSEYMLKYINDTDLRYNHGLVATRAFQKFKMDKCVDAYASLFNKLMYK